jgi:hypothetical protein
MCAALVLCKIMNHVKKKTKRAATSAYSKASEREKSNENTHQSSCTSAGERHASAVLMGGWVRLDCTSG